MNCTWNLLRKAVSQTPRHRPLCIDERDIPKSDIFSEKTVQNLGGIYGSGRSPSLARIRMQAGIRLFCYRANYFPGHGPVSPAFGRSAQPERSGRAPAPPLDRLSR
jgi:hypothetical protein